jgi:hypothetical protein
MVENVAGYYSHDAGKTWQLSFAHEEGASSEPASVLYVSISHASSS